MYHTNPILFWKLPCISQKYPHDAFQRFENNFTDFFWGKIRGWGGGLTWIKVFYTSISILQKETGQVVWDSLYKYNSEYLFLSVLSVQLKSPCKTNYSSARFTGQDWNSQTAKIIHVIPISWSSLESVSDYS